MRKLLRCLLLGLMLSAGVLGSGCADVNVDLGDWTDNGEDDDVEQVQTDDD
jgi:hypothetical protein